MLNVKPGTKEYEMLLTAITESDAFDGITEHKVPATLELSDKYRSSIHNSIPLGIDTDDNSTVLYWNSEVPYENHESAHLSIAGKNPSDRTTLIHNILDHLSRHKENANIIYVASDEDMNAVTEKLGEIENLTHYTYENPSFLDTVWSYTQNRLKLLKEKRLLNTYGDDPEFQKMTSVYLVVHDLEQIMSSDINAPYDASERDRTLSGIIYDGKKVGIHLAFGCERRSPMVLRGANWNHVDMNIETKREKNNFRADVRLTNESFVHESTIVPFHLA